jgi:hypothetical protein
MPALVKCETFPKALFYRTKKIEWTPNVIKHVLSNHFHIKKLVFCLASFIIICNIKKKKAIHTTFWWGFKHMWVLPKIKLWRTLKVLARLITQFWRCNHLWSASGPKWERFIIFTYLLAFRVGDCEVNTLKVNKPLLHFSFWLKVSIWHLCKGKQLFPIKISFQNPCSQIHSLCLSKSWETKSNFLRFLVLIIQIIYRNHFSQIGKLSSGSEGLYRYDSKWKKYVSLKATHLCPGVDVMITIFCDFCQFSVKKWRFSQKPMLWSFF